MRERQRRRPADVILADLGAPSSAASARAACAVTMSPRTPSIASAAHAPVIRSSSRSGSRTASTRARAAAIRSASAVSASLPGSGERHGVALEGEPAAHDLRPLRRIALRAHLDAEPEAI